MNIFWAVPLLIALAVLIVLGLVRWLSSVPRTIIIGRFKSRAEAERYARDFESALERDKNKARYHLIGRSTL